MSQAPGILGTNPCLPAGESHTGLYVQNRQSQKILGSPKKNIRIVVQMPTGHNAHKLKQCVIC